MGVLRPMSRTVSRQGSVARTVQRRADTELAEPSPRGTSAFAGDLGEEGSGDDELRASEQLHRSIVETLDEGIMVQDARRAVRRVQQERAADPRAVAPSSWTKEPPIARSCR